MNLNGRVSRLERFIDPDPDGEVAEDTSAYEITEAQRVEGLRRIWHAVYRGEGPEPFAHLEGKEYMAAFWKWFLRNGESWPDWAKRAVGGVGWPCDDSGRPLPPEERVAQVTRWWQEEQESGEAEQQFQERGVRVHGPRVTNV